MTNAWIPAVVSIILAVVPVIIWIRLIPKEGESRIIYIKTFLFGTFSVVPPFILIVLFDHFPQLNIYSLIDRSVAQVALAALLTNIVVGIVEEIAKHTIVRVIDRRHPEYLQTIASALKLSICAGLGFSFAENIFYFYNVWTNPDFQYSDVFSTFIFRSLFTMCGHMVFSGIFGYYFGLGKFAADLTEKARWEGKRFWISHLIGKITGRPTFQVMREQLVMTGLFIAIAMHAGFDLVLDLGYKLPAIGIVVSGAVYIWYLMRTKTGHMLFSFTKRRQSSMADKDEEVVIELLGMWTKEGKLKEVIDICDRLLQRDPDNNVVKLFKAKASDNAQLRQVYLSLKSVFEKKSGKSAPQTAPTMNLSDEKTVLEVMNQWYEQGNYKQVLDVANRLLARNPNSQGAQLLLQKAIDKEKLQGVFESVSKLFKD